MADALAWAPEVPMSVVFLTGIASFWALREVRIPHHVAFATAAGRL